MFEHGNLLLKSPQNTKIGYQILLSVKKNKYKKSDIYQKYFQIKLSILPMNHQCDVPLWKILLLMMYITTVKQIR